MKQKYKDIGGYILAAVLMAFFIFVAVMAPGTQ